MAPLYLMHEICTRCTGETADSGQEHAEKFIDAASIFVVRMLEGVLPGDASSSLATSRWPMFTKRLEPSTVRGQRG